MESQIWNEDCNTGLDRIPDGSVDLVMMDLPYLMETGGGGPSVPPIVSTMENCSLSRRVST